MQKGSGWLGAGRLLLGEDLDGRIVVHLGAHRHLAGAKQLAALAFFALVKGRGAGTGGSLELILGF